MDFELVGDLTDIETIAAGRGIRDLARLRRLYGKGYWRKMLADEDARRDGDLRVIDESGEDYLFSADRFVAIEVPAAVKDSLLKRA